MFMLQNNTATLNKIFNSQLLLQIGDQKIGKDMIEDNSCLSHIERDLGHLVRGKEKT